MPLYEFKCQECGHDFEELCPMGTKDWPCPNCRSGNTLRRISTFSARSAGESGTRNISGGGCGSCHGGHCSSCH